MLSSIPLNETVFLDVVYEFETDDVPSCVRSPFSGPMPLRKAIRLAINMNRTGVRVSIMTARGTTYRDIEEMRRIWSRRDFFMR